MPATIIPGFLDEDEASSPDHPDKLCPACRRVLFYASFDRNEFSGDGYYTYCKECRAAKKKDKEDPPPVLETMAVPPNPAVPRGAVPQGILNGIQVPEHVETPMEGVWAWYTPKGWRVVAVHYSADPEKRPGTESGDAWIRKKKNETSERDWKREYELDHTISEGDPFYATFNRSIHVRRCVYDDRRPLIRGWDFGRRHPAVVWAQLDEKNKVRVLYSEIYSNLTIYKLVPIVLAETNTRFPGAKCVDYGDPAGKQETDKGATTAILLGTFKIHLVYRFSFVEEGTKMIDMKLLVQDDGLPGLLIDPTDNKELITAFESGYVFETSGKDGEGQQKNTPKKDGWFDNIMDALRYIFVNAFSMLPDSQADKDKAWEKIGLWRTNEQHAAKTADADPIGEFYS